MTQHRGAMRDGWSKTGVLTSGTTQVRGYTMQADFSLEGKGSGAQYYTVQFGVTPPRGATGIFHCVAEIEWSTEGKTVQRKITVANGASISGTAQHAKVAVYDLTDLAAYPPLVLTPEQYVVDTLITPGVRPNLMQPPRYIPPSVETFGTVPGVYLLGPGDTCFVPIERDIGVISAKVNAMGAGAPFAPVQKGEALVSFVVQGSNVSMGAFDTQDSTEWEPVPPVATHMLLLNNSVIADLQFTVAYGIEG